jgi:hypothetical protein
VSDFVICSSLGARDAGVASRTYWFLDRNCGQGGHPLSANRAVPGDSGAAPRVDVLPHRQRQRGACADQHDAPVTMGPDGLVQGGGEPARSPNVLQARSWPGRNAHNEPEGLIGELATVVGIVAAANGPAWEPALCDLRRTHTTPAKTGTPGAIIVVRSGEADPYG